jgi:hypothetical protein
VTYRLTEGNSTEWLFLSKLAVYLGGPSAPGQNSATGLVIAPPGWESTDYLTAKHPKKHQNGHLRASITTYKSVLLTQEVQEVQFYLYQLVLELSRKI